MTQLHESLKSGRILATGSVDGQARRAIPPAEWYDYDLRRIRFLSSYTPGKAATEFVEVVSKRAYPSGAINLHNRPTKTNVPSAQSSSSEPGYHRVIDDVLLSREEVIRCWSENGSSSSIHSAIHKRKRTAPARDAAAAAIKKIYPDGVPDQVALPHGALWKRVGEELKNTPHANISKDTVLRAAGRDRRKRR